MKIKNLEDLFRLELHDIYDAEQRLLKALPKMAAAATSPDLARAFEEHVIQTKGQADRLERIFQQLDEKTKRHTCDAMKGLVAEAEEIIEASGDESSRDAGLIAAAQKVEHYEIASYGTLVTWAQQLGHHEVAGLLRETLNEEKTTDEKLTQLAENSLNVAASRA